jgi:hypothetical protein
LKPCILVTPAVLLKVGYVHGGLEGYRLKDAVDFQTVRRFSEGYEKQRFKGLEYRFTFPDGSVTFLVKDNARVQALEKVLNRARTRSASGDTQIPVSDEDWFPATAGSPNNPEWDPYTWYGWLLNPCGILWMILAAVFGLVLALALFIGLGVLLYVRATRSP